MNKKLVLATVATIAAVTAQGVKADEVQGTTGTGNEASTVTAPIVEIPEWKGGTTPFDAPQLDKPEWEGGVVPFDAPVLEKPEINIEDIPMMPPAPVLDKPELIIDIPKPQPKQDKPKQDKPTEINSKPSKTTVEPQKEQANVIYQPTETNAHTLPNTGSESTLILSFAGMFILSGVARIALKRE